MAVHVLNIDLRLSRGGRCLSSYGILDFEWVMGKAGTEKMPSSRI